jgi:hypothetical protein
VLTFDITSDKFRERCHVWKDATVSVFQNLWHQEHVGTRTIIGLVKRKKECVSLLVVRDLFRFAISDKHRLIWELVGRAHFVYHCLPQMCLRHICNFGESDNKYRIILIENQQMHQMTTLRVAINDDPRPARPKTSTDERSVKLVADVLAEDRIVMSSQILLHVSAYQCHHQGVHMILTSYLYIGVCYKKNDGVSNNIASVSIVTLWKWVVANCFQQRLAIPTCIHSVTTPTGTIFPRYSIMLPVMHADI